MADIDLSGFDGKDGRPAFNIIGTSYDNTFTGVFDGNGHTISHVTITGKDHLGLFGLLEPGAEVKNLGVVDVNIAGSGDYVGGLVGENVGAVTACYSTGIVSGDSSVGGLVGRNGGRLGDSWDGGGVTNCYSTAAVTGTGDCVGGLVGSNTGNWPAESIVASSFWDTQTSGQTTSDGGTGTTTAQIQDMQTYREAGWDFVGEKENGLHEVWQMPEGGGYPVLAILRGYTPPKLQGLGTPQDPYLISDAMELGAMIYYNPYAHYRLAASIDLSGIRWGAAVIPWFAGAFDGTGLTISHLTINGASNLGLFGRLESGAEVKDLGLVEVNITSSGNYVGGLAGAGGTITNCYATGRVSGKDYVGGLVGSGGTITNCDAAASVSGEDCVGGLVGYNYSGTVVTRCSSTGAVTGTGWGVGGLVGYNWWGEVTQCYSSGAVSGNNYVAGLMGHNNYGQVTKCYSTGAVNGTGWAVGGLVGYNNRGTVTDCFWDIETSGQATSDVGMGKTTAEMQTASTFLEAGWDFVGETQNGTENIWAICEGLDYPKLAWQFVIGDYNGDGHTDFMDFCIFGQRWLGTESSFFCAGGGTDLTNDGFIRFEDLMIFADKWLTRMAP